MTQLAFMLHFGLTLFMTGVIWIVQLVHYPGFRYVSAQSFAEFSVFHQQMITWVVGPVMVFELITGIYLLTTPLLSPLVVINLLLILAIWASTFFLSVPIHEKLTHAYDLPLIESLVLTNWPRTLLWSVRAMGLIYIGGLVGKIY
jgi:hypothetical protein